MRLSIRTKLFLAGSGLVAFFVGFSLLLNNLYLNEYYLWQKKNILIESLEMLNENYQGDLETIGLQLEKLERNQGLNVYIIGPGMELKYNPAMRLFGMGGPGRKGMEMTLWMHVLRSDLWQRPQGEYRLEVVEDPRLKTNFLLLTGRLKTGELLVLSLPVAAIDESTAVANRFFLFTGLITMFLGGLGAYIFARRFTRPILELNELAQHMARLDFSRKYSGPAHDELGQLGQSINSMSEQLDHAISQLREDIERERRIDQMRKEFVSNVSHELKTPIALIQGYAEGLKLNVNEDEESRNFYCDVIIDEAGKMNRLVRDLLDLSRIESGYLQLERTEFDLAELLRQIVEKFRPLLNEQGVDIGLDLPGALPVLGDVGRIEQVVINYLNNAINHLDQRKQLRIKARRRGEKVRVEVFNSGQPIPVEAMEKIWTSFYKIDKARTRAYGGTGLGLAVVRAIMELHQNGYGVENLPDGVSFWFELDFHQTAT
ncbi:MAG: sensor histidine kinase [Bacillota bacterium]